jgi:hypothetical protein
MNGAEAIFGMERLAAFLGERFPTAMRTAGPDPADVAIALLTPLPTEAGVRVRCLVRESSAGQACQETATVQVTAERIPERLCVVVCAAHALAYEDRLIPAQWAVTLVPPVPRPPIKHDDFDAEGWVIDGAVALCPQCRRVREGTAGWFLSHSSSCGWRPTLAQPT